MKGTVVMVAGALTDPFFGAIQSGADTAAQEAGVSFKYLPATIDGPDLGQALQQALASGPAALAVGNWYPAAENPYIEKAVKAGIPVVEVNAAPQNWAASGALALVGQSDYDAGQTAAKQFVAAGDKNVLCIDHVPGAQNLTQRCDGVQAVLSAAGGTSKVINIPSNDQNNSQATQQDIQAAVQTDKGVDGIITLGTDQAIDAVDAAGSNSKITIGTFDLSTAVLGDVQSGKITFAVDQQPYLQGYDAVSALANDLKYDLHPVGQVDTGPFVLTKANVARVIQVNQEYHGVLGAS